MPTHNHSFRDKANLADASPRGLTLMGAFFPIEIHVPPQIAQALTDKGEQVPPPGTGLALVDTGATMTCVHEDILAGLGLKPIGVINTGTANGPATKNQYPARIVFPTKGWTIDLSAVTSVNLTGQEIQTSPPQPIVLLIGRNILENWVMIWNGPLGVWTVAF